MFDRTLENVQNKAQADLKTIKNDINEGLTLCKDNIQELNSIYVAQNSQFEVDQLTGLEAKYQKLLAKFQDEKIEGLIGIRQELNSIQTDILEMRSDLLRKSTEELKTEEAKIKSIDTLYLAIKDEIYKIHLSTGRVTVAGDAQQLFAKAAQTTKNEYKKRVTTSKPDEIDKIKEEIRILDSFLQAYMIETTSATKIGNLKDNRDKHDSKPDSIKKKIAEIENYVLNENLSLEIQEQQQRQRPPKKIEEHIQLLEEAISKLPISSEPNISAQIAFIKRDLKEIETHIRKNLTQLMMRDVPSEVKNGIELDINLIENKLQQADKHLTEILKGMVGLPAEKLAELNGINETLAKKYKIETKTPSDVLNIKLAEYNKKTSNNKNYTYAEIDNHLKFLITVFSNSLTKKPIKPRIGFGNPHDLIKLKMIENLLGALALNPKPNLDNVKEIFTLLNKLIQSGKISAKDERNFQKQFDELHINKDALETAISKQRKAEKRLEKHYPSWAGNSIDRIPNALKKLENNTFFKAICEEAKEQLSDFQSTGKVSLDSLLLFDMASIIQEILDKGEAYESLYKSSLQLFQQLTKEPRNAYLAKQISENFINLYKTIHIPENYAKLTEYITAASLSLEDVKPYQSFEKSFARNFIPSSEKSYAHDVKNNLLGKIHSRYLVNEKASRATFQEIKDDHKKYLSYLIDRLPKESNIQIELKDCLTQLVNVDIKVDSKVLLKILDQSYTAILRASSELDSIEKNYFLSVIKSGNIVKENEALSNPREHGGKNDENLFNIISWGDVERYIRKSPDISKIEFKNYMALLQLRPHGEELLGLIERIAAAESNKDNGILQRFSNGYIFAGEKKLSADLKNGSYGGYYKRISDGADFLFKQDSNQAVDIKDFVIANMLQGLRDVGESAVKKLSFHSRNPDSQPYLALRILRSNLKTKKLLKLKDNFLDPLTDNDIQSGKGELGILFKEYYAKKSSKSLHSVGFANALNQEIQNLTNRLALENKVFTSHDFNNWLWKDRVAFARSIGIENPNIHKDPLLNSKIANHIHLARLGRIKSLKQYELDLKLSLCFKMEAGNFVLDSSKKDEFNGLIQENINLHKDDPEFKAHFARTGSHKINCKLRSDLSAIQKLSANQIFNEKVTQAYRDAFKKPPQALNLQSVPVKQAVINETLSPIIKPHTPSIYEENADALIHNMKHIFTSIPLHEFAQMKNTPHYDALAHASTQLSFFVQDDILACEHLEDAFVAKEKWINKMDACWKAGDHQSAHAISAAFDMHTIYRLDRINEKLSTHSVEILNKYKAIFSTSNQNENYKRELSLEENQPIVPSVGALIGSLRGVLAGIKNVDSALLKNDERLIKLSQMQTACREKLKLENSHSKDVSPVKLPASTLLENSSKMGYPSKVGEYLIAQIEDGGVKKAMAVNSLFEIVGAMDPYANKLFFMALLRQYRLGMNEAIKHDPAITHDEASFTRIINAYTALSTARKDSQKAAAKKLIEDAQTDIKLIQKHLTQESYIKVPGWENALSAIPRDTLNMTNIFTTPIALIDTNHPRHEDLRLSMSRDLNHYRYVAPKGAGGKQEAGPLGGWYIGCYRTPNGQIHTQRFMVKREKNYSKNIIESVCGRLKSTLVNIEKDYSAGTFLARKAKTKATGENTYAVSIAFDDFKELHKLAGYDDRAFMAGSQKKLPWKNAKGRAIFDYIEDLHSKEDSHGLEEALIAAWWTGDKDVHSGNVGFSKKMKRFLGIDHTGGMEALDVKVHPGRGGLISNFKRWASHDPEPTYHGNEYSSEIRNGEKMAIAIERYTNQMSAAKIKEKIDDEIDNAVINYKDDPEVFKKFAMRASVPKEKLKGNDIYECAEITKQHLYPLMYARMMNLRQYGKEIELSLCFEYKKNPENNNKKEFVVKDQQKLAQFIRENPNYSLGDKHHFRGKSNGESLTWAYHQSHNQLSFTHGYKIELLLAKEREKVLVEQQNLSIFKFMAKDFKTTPTLDIYTRAEAYKTRLASVKEILNNLQIFANNPYHEKIDELLEFLEKYKSGISQQHLIQVCDDAYVIIERVFRTLDLKNDNNVDLLAKIKIYETFSKRDRGEEPDWKTFTIEGSDYTQAINLAATNLRYEAKSSTEVTLLEEDLKAIASVRTQISSLEEKEPKKIVTAIEDKDVVHPQPLEPTIENNVPPKKEYFATAHPLFAKEDLSFQEQGAQYFNKESGAANIAVTASSPNPDESTGVILDNPANPGKAGAVMINENGKIKIFDFENPEISFAKVLSKILLPYIIPMNLDLETKEKALYEYTKKYIEDLQDSSRMGGPELVSKDNLQDRLIKDLANKNSMSKPGGIQLQIPKGTFFQTSIDSFSSKIFQTFEVEISKQRGELLSWAIVWIKTLEAEGCQPKDMFLEGSSGNTEFARLFLILVCAKGEGLSNLDNANKTKYDFKITANEITLMREVLKSQNPKTTFEALFTTPRALIAVIDKIKCNLTQKIEDKNLESAKKQYMNDQIQLKRLDPGGKFMPIYGDVQVKLSDKINDLNSRLQKLEESYAPRNGGPRHD